MLATAEEYGAMLDGASAGGYAFPAINVTSSQTLNAALRGFAEARSDGIVQIAVGGARHLSGAAGDAAAGARALAALAALAGELADRLYTTPADVDGAGTLTPAALEPLRERMAQVDGVSAVGEPVLTEDRQDARIDVALRHGPFTKAAMDTVRGPLRDTARSAAPAGATTMVGGTSAAYADIADAVERDMRRILPVAAGLILVILLVTLRSAVAPLYLLAAVVLEFAATLGAAVLAFQQLGGEAGVAFLLPLTMFLFVVALGAVSALHGRF